MRFWMAAAVAGCVMVSAVDAAAQDESRFFISVNTAFEPGTEEFTDDGTFSLYDETGRLTVAGASSSGAVLDFGAGAKVYGQMTLGASFHRTASADDATISGTVPHPIFFDRPRAFSQTLEGLKRNEQALHLSVGYVFPLGDKFDVHVFAGPSQFRYTQQVVGSVSITETSSAFTSVQATPAIVSRKKNTWGGHIGADLSYPFYETGATTFRLGAYVRYAEASSEFVAVNNVVSTKVGGTQIGAGLRVRF